MTYPHTRLTRNIRISIMISLIIIFFIVSPLVILYTAGFRYDFRTHTIKETGVISIDIEPRDATVKLNGITINKRIPIRLANRAPGRYRLTIEKEGYHTLEKDIEVQSKQTTYVRDVPLFKHSAATPVFIDPVPNESVVRFSEDGTYAFVASHNRENAYADVALIDVKGKRTITTLATPSDTAPEIDWGPASSHGLIITSSDTATTYHLFDAARPDRTYSYAITSTSSSHQWHEQKNNSSLYIEDGNRLIELSPDGIVPYSAISYPVWHVDSQKNVWEYDIKNHTLSKKTENIIQKSWNLSDAVIDIVSIQDAYILVRTPRGIAIGSLQHDAIIPLDHLSTDRIRHTSQRNEWISWSHSEIWHIDNHGKKTLLTRLGLSIQQVYLLDEFGTLLIDTGDRLLGFHPFFLFLQPLFDHGQITAHGIDQKNRIIYFSSTSDKERAVLALPY